MSREQDEPTRPTPTDSLSALRYPVFRGVWAASTLGNLGGMVQSVGASWLMLSMAQSADMVALVQASLTLPVVMLSLVAGAMADNLDRRQVMIGAQVFMLIASLALMVCAWSGWITPWLLLLLTFAIGCGAAFNSPAWQASVGDMVPRAELPGAVALNSMGFNIARSLGPAIGGLIVAAAGAATAFAVNTVACIPLIGVLARWRPPKASRVLPPEALGHAIASGVRYVAMSPTIRLVLLRSAVFGIAAGALMALMPVIAKVLLAGGPLTYGMLLGAFGLGAVAGALANARLRARMPTESIVRYASLCLAAATGIVAMSGSMLATLPALLLAGAGWLLALATFNVAVQMSAPRWVVARSLSLYQMSTFAGIALGSWLWGLVTHVEDVRIALLIAGTALFLSALLGLPRPLAETADLNLEPLQRWRVPETRVPVEPRTGPVVVTIQFRIAEEDVIEFLRAMDERRRIRRRDGANDWKLLRDLSDPEIWVERYSTPTWLDYVRLNSRLTHEDAVIPEKLRALHRGPDRPLVRRMIERQTGSLPVTQPSSARDLAEPLT